MKIKKKRIKIRPGSDLQLNCFVHFRNQNLKNITCETCLDKKDGNCQGNNLKGIQCVLCMDTHSVHNIYIIDKNWQYCSTFRSIK